MILQQLQGRRSVVEMEVGVLILLHMIALMLVS
jgi:hypothetical protein